MGVVNSKLLDAARQGDAHKVRKYLAKGANVDICTKDQAAPLWIAAQNGHVDAIRVLLDAKPDVNLRFRDDVAPLWIASQNGHVGVVKLLLEAGAHVNCQSKDQATPLWIASQYGHTAVVEALLNAKANVNCQFQNGESPLWIASQNGHTAVVQLLLRHQANPQLCNQGGKSPVDVAATDEIRRLLQQASDAEPAGQRPFDAFQTFSSLASFPSLAPDTPSYPEGTRRSESGLSTIDRSLALWFPGATIAVGAIGVGVADVVNSGVAEAVLSGLQLGFSQVLRVAGAIAVANPVDLILVAARLINAIHTCHDNIQYCKAKAHRLSLRLAALLPALSVLHDQLEGADSGVDKGIIESLTTSMAYLLKVLLQLRQLFQRFETSQATKLSSMVAFLSSHGYKQQFDTMDHELLMYLTQLTTVLNIAQFTKPAAAAMAEQEALVMRNWKQQDEEDRKADLQKLEGAILWVAGGVVQLQQQLEQQKVVVDEQVVTLKRVSDWLHDMNAAHSQIMAQLHEKIDNMNEKLNQIMDFLSTKSNNKKGAVPTLLIPRSRITILPQELQNATSGGYGTVIRCLWDGTPVAVKIYNYKKVDRAVDRSEAVKEALYLTMANHPCVVRCFGIVYDPDSTEDVSIQGSLVMEWVPNGSLSRWLPDDATLQLRVELTHQVAAGMRHLHGQEVIHGDLKPSNILATWMQTPHGDMPQLKICDFGLSLHKSTTLTHTRTAVASSASTLEYTSPERIRNPRMRCKADDVYAFGILMHFLATGSCNPYPDVRPDLLRDSVTDPTVRPDIDGWANDSNGLRWTEGESQVVREYAALAKRCWAADPAARPSFVEIYDVLEALKGRL